MNARAQVGFIGSSSRVLQLAGTVNDPGLGNGGVLGTAHAAAGGYDGRATFVNRFGSVTTSLRVSVHTLGQLTHLGVTAAVTAATGRFAGARGRLTGNTTVNPAFGVGSLRLRGTLRGVAGRAPAPPSATVVRHVNGRFEGIELSLNRGGEETIVGPVTGVVPGPAVVVVHDRATTTRVRGTFSMFAAGGSLSGAIDLRFRGSGSVRSESGTVTITGGSGGLGGARTTAPAAVSGTRDFRSQRIALRIRGAFIP